MSSLAAALETASRRVALDADIWIAKGPSVSFITIPNAPVERWPRATVGTP